VLLTYWACLDWDARWTCAVVKQCCYRQINLASQVKWLICNSIRAEREIEWITGRQMEAVFQHGSSLLSFYIFTFDWARIDQIGLLKVEKSLSISLQLCAPSEPIFESHMSQLLPRKLLCVTEEVLARAWVDWAGPPGWSISSWRLYLFGWRFLEYWLWDGNVQTWLYFLHCLIKSITQSNR